MLKAKVLVVGPPKCGKTVLSNFLSDTIENIVQEYRPTKGVRIVEFERRNLNVKGPGKGFYLNVFEWVQLSAGCIARGALRVGGTARGW